MVKCNDCGFLSLRNRYTGQLEEANEQYRTSGKPSDLRRPGVTHAKSPLEFFDWPHEPEPICFARAFRLDDEVQRDQQGNRTAESILEVVGTDRTCAEFCKSHQGFTPKEHREMIDREQLLRWQEGREQIDRVWREEQRRQDLEWREQQERRADRRHRSDIFWIAIVASVISAAAAITASFIN